MKIPLWVMGVVLRVFRFNVAKLRRNWQFVKILLRLGGFLLRLYMYDLLYLFTRVGYGQFLSDFDGSSPENEGKNT